MEGDAVNPNLPPEILTEIFRLAKPKREPTHLVPLEVIFSHVCAEWRETILADSRVWSAINIHSPRTIARADAYLSRTADALPVHVRIELYDYDRKTKASRAKREFVRALVAFLKACIHRCKTLLVFTYHEITAHDIVTGLETISAPILGRFRVNCLPPDPDGSPIHMATTEVLKGGAPKLTFLELEGIPVHPALGSLITLHLHNLKPSWFDYDVFKNLCAQLTSLRNLSLHAQSYITAWPMDLNAPTIMHKSLQSLKIMEIHPGLLVRVLLSLDAPRLSSVWLSADTTSFHHLFDSPQFAGGASKFAHVRYLTLEAYNMRSLNKFANVFPGATHIFLPEALLFHIQFFEEAFSASPPVWPKLQTLALTAKSDRRYAKLKEVLCKIVNARAALKVPLARFLADWDLVTFLRKQQSDMLAESLEVAEMDGSDYAEPWWVMLHENHPDSIGLS